MASSTTPKKILHHFCTAGAPVSRGAASVLAACGPHRAGFRPEGDVAAVIDVTADAGALAAEDGEAAPDRLQALGLAVGVVGVAARLDAPGVGVAPGPEELLKALVDLVVDLVAAHRLGQDALH